MKQVFFFLKQKKKKKKNVIASIIVFRFYSRHFLCNYLKLFPDTFFQRVEMEE